MPDINANFNLRVMLDTENIRWAPSPAGGVERRMLDRVGDEVARATSIVRYAANSRFPAHTHGGGEEFLVLEGVFQDEHGDWPAGSYVRNPPTSRHTPGSEPGCIIFVKLWQFDPDDRTAVRLRPDDISARRVETEPGLGTALLHRDSRESVTLEDWAPERSIRVFNPGGVELLVIEGLLTEGEDILFEGGWLRLPVGSEANLTAGPEGCRLWVKRGHLNPVLYRDGPSA